MAVTPREEEDGMKFRDDGHDLTYRLAVGLGLDGRGQG